MAIICVLFIALLLHVSRVYYAEKDDDLFDTTNSDNRILFRRRWGLLVQLEKCYHYFRSYVGLYLNTSRKSTISIFHINGIFRWQDYILTKIYAMSRCHLSHTFYIVVGKNRNIVALDLIYQTIIRSDALKKLCSWLSI